MKKITTLSVVLATMVMLFGQLATAQDQGQPGRRGQRGAGQQDQQGRGQRGPQGRQQRGGRGISMIALAEIEAVQADIEMLEHQVKELEVLRDELQDARGSQADRGRGRGDDTEDLSEEEIQRMRDERRAQATEEAAAMAKKETEGLKEILLEDQFARLHEIYVQALGAGALQNEMIAKELKISDRQKSEMEEVSAEAREAAMEEFGQLRESGDREAMQKRMTEIRTEIENKVMGVLTAKQKSDFEKMKGEPFELPADAMRGQRGGRGGGRPGGGRPGNGGA